MVSVRACEGNFVIFDDCCPAGRHTETKTFFLQGFIAPAVAPLFPCVRLCPQSYVYRCQSVPSPPPPSFPLSLSAVSLSLFGGWFCGAHPKMFSRCSLHPLYLEESNRPHAALRTSSSTWKCCCCSGCTCVDDTQARKTGSSRARHYRTPTPGIRKQFTIWSLSHSFGRVPELLLSDSQRTYLNSKIVYYVCSCSTAPPPGKGGARLQPLAQDTSSFSTDVKQPQPPPPPHEAVDPPHPNPARREKHLCMEYRYM